MLVLDDFAEATSPADEPFDVLRPEDLGLDRAEFFRMAACYDVLELATAAKPWLLQALLDRGDEVVVYLDPDMVVFDSLDALARAALASIDGIALTPHRLTPVPQDDLRPSETELLRSGVFNLGFIAVRSAARPFLSWWQERLRRDCITNPDAGVFVDQRWIDEVPALWQPTVVRDHGYNLAYWNADERPLRQIGDAAAADHTWPSAGTLTAGPDLLRLVHFSGFSPDQAHVLSRNTADRPRVLLSDHPVLEALTAQYAEDLDLSGRLDAQKIEYGFAQRVERFSHRPAQPASLPRRTHGFRARRRTRAAQPLRGRGHVRRVAENTLRGRPAAGLALPRVGVGRAG